MRTKEKAMCRVVLFIVAIAITLVPLGGASAHSPCAPGDTTDDGHICFSEQSECDSGDPQQNGFDPGAPLQGTGNAGSGSLLRGSACVTSSSGTVAYVGGSGGTDGACGEVWLGDEQLHDTDAEANNANACP